MDFAAEGLMDGLEPEQRAARGRLLQSLLDQGVALEELKAAVAEDRLVLLPVERMLAGRYTAEDVEKLTGLPAATLLRIRRSLGLPEGLPGEQVFCQADVDAARSIRTFIEAGFDEEAIAEISRVLGDGMARVSATAGAAFGQTFLRPGDSEDETAWRFASMAESLTDAFQPVLAASFRAHVLDNVRRTMISGTELATGQLAGEQELAVCFADLVGFTHLGSELETRELGDVVRRFGEIAASVATPPVRLVKTIGDAALLGSREPRALVAAALRLLDEVEAADLPTVRAGVAWGLAIPRSGDLYGHAVNLASRVTGIARPGSVLCTEEVRDAAPDFDWSYAGRHRLKGISDGVPLFRARQPKTPASTGEQDANRPAGSPDGHDSTDGRRPGPRGEPKKPKAGRRRR
ncbi:MAG TPA: adenylate cyclase regulatory domain-containing protein [Solirubrobacteraceae bacterium]|nr:adenylate cyclase regulatory domain-containing protein [Solirubrobacteraceae bacterium]